MTCIIKGLLGPPSTLAISTLLDISKVDIGRYMLCFFLNADMDVNFSQYMLIDVDIECQNWSKYVEKHHLQWTFFRQGPSKRHQEGAAQWV